MTATASRFEEWWATGVEHGWVEVADPPPCRREAFTGVALDADPGDGGIRRSVNQHAADLADRLSDGCLPWSTDEPAPDLRPLWSTSKQCRARPVDHRARLMHNRYRMPVR